MKSKKHEKDKSHKNFVGKGYGKRNSEELPDRQGSDPDKTPWRSSEKGSEGAQGYGKYKEE